MRKVLLFALTVAIALGGIGFAHAAVAESQDALLIYPLLEAGDSAALDGHTVEMTFSCGEHLLWNSTHRFGTGTETAFVYDREGIAQTSLWTRNQLEFWLSGGTSTSTNGSFSLNRHSYGSLFRAVADETPKGGSQTMRLRMADYVDYYAPDFQLYYTELNRQCSYSTSFMDTLDSRDWADDDAGIYDAFLNRFRFPVQEVQLVDVTIHKDDIGQINSIEFFSEFIPELYAVSHVSSEGIWFLFIFRDSQGTPLPYESPQGHGIYFVPWQVLATHGTQVYVAPDLSHLQKVVDLDAELLIDHIEIDGEKSECRMLSREGGSYVFTTWDLNDGSQKSRLEVLPNDPTSNSFGTFSDNGAYLLVCAQSQLALVDPARSEILLTAPDVKDQRYRAALHDAQSGTLHFDGNRLYLLNPVYSYHDGAFWTAVWQEGELLYYGEYDCSLMGGNRDFYYRPITLEPVSLRWK